MINFNNCKQVVGWFGGNSGRKLQVEYDGSFWILKFPGSMKNMKRKDMSYTTSVFSEYLGSHIFEILNIPVHDTVLGFIDEKLVVGCRNFNDAENNIYLVEYRELRNTYQPELNKLVEETLTPSDKLLHGTNLKEVIYNLQLNPVLADIPNSTEYFWNMVVVDTLIKNNDRNSGNWGILTDRKNIYEMAPVYDNGGSFSSKLSDYQMETILNDPVRFKQSNFNVDSGYFYDGSPLQFKDLLHIDDDNLKKAVLYMKPIIEDKMDEIESFIASIPNEQDGYKITSDIQKQFYIDGMKERFSQMIVPAYEEIVEQHKTLHPSIS